MANECVSVPEAAKRLGFTLKYVYDLLYSGRLKADKQMGRWRIPTEEIEARLKIRSQKMRSYLLPRLLAVSRRWPSVAECRPTPSGNGCAKANFDLSDCVVGFCFTRMHQLHPKQASR